MTYNNKSFKDKIRHLILKWTLSLQKGLDKIIKPNKKEKIRRIMLETDSVEGRRFDTILIIFIVASIIIVMLETIQEVQSRYYYAFYALEWIFTIIFTIEYLLRIYVERNPIKYMRSFFGIVDLLAIIPTYLSVFLLGPQNFLIIRILRLLRIFRIFKLGQFVSEGGIVISALRASKNKIFVFVSFIVLMAFLIGALQYMVEGHKNPQFSSIPHGIYWAVVTLTTVGYGDITPITPVGRLLATCVMILGYGVIAVPTGIVTAEISNRVLKFGSNNQVCGNCHEINHTKNASFCHSCGLEIDS